MRKQSRNLELVIRVISALVLVFSIAPFTAFSQASDDSAIESLSDLLDTEITTASKYEQTVSEAPASVTIVTAEEIRRFGYRTLADVLANVRGFYVSDDRNYGYLGNRGFGRPADYNSRFLLLVNGVAVNEDFYGSMGIAPDFSFDMRRVERIEIVRGPSSALYGTGAMFATINIVTKSGAEVDGGRVSADGGSFGRVSGSVAVGKETANGSDFTLSGQWGSVSGEDLYFEEYDDPETNNGLYADNDHDDFYDLWASMEMGNFSVQGYFSSRDKGIPTASYETDFNDPTAETTDEWGFLNLGYSQELSESVDLRLRAYANKYEYMGVYPYEGYPFFDANDSQWWGLVGEALWEVRSNHRLIAGVQYEDHNRVRYTSWDEWETYVDLDIPFDVLSLYLQDTYELTPRFSVTAGLRYDDYSDVGSSTTPRLAFVFHPTDTHTLKLLYGEAFRRPNHYEVYYEDDDLNKANPDLEPEEIQTLEVVWEHQLSPALSGTAAVFRYDLSNLIDAVLDETDELVQFQNVGEVEAWGIELELRALFQSGVWGYVSYTYQDAEAVGGGSLTNSPSHLALAGATTPIVDWLQGSAQLRYGSERLTVQDTNIDSSLVVDLHLTTNTIRDRFDVAFRVLNVFDEEYETPGGFEHLQDGLPQPGRHFRFDVNVTF